MKEYLQNGKFRAIYALVSTLIIFSIFIMVMMCRIDVSIKDVALVIIGALIGELKTISSYYYGGMDKSQSVPKEDKGKKDNGLSKNT